jgi:maleate isomerase
VLQADRRIEADFRQLLPGGANLFVSRVASAPEVTSETLAAMEGDLARAASLFPRGMTFDAVGYGCTSGTAEIGADRVAELIGGAIATRAVTNPVTALIAACREGGLRRLGIVSPYLAPVANKLCQVLNAEGIETPLRTDFGIAEEAEVARIDCETLVTAATELARQGGIDAVFLSCTNLDTLEAQRRLRTRLDIPVMSSNTVLEWHMVRLAGIQRQEG